MDISKLTFDQFPDNIRWEQIDQHLKDLRVQAETINEQKYNTSILQLNTITEICVTSNVFNLTKIVDHIKIIDEKSIEQPAKRSSRKDRKDNDIFTSVKKKKKADTEFYNSVTWRFVVKDGDVKMNLAVKIFPNGKLQFAGFRSIKACAIVPYMVCSYLNNIVDTDLVLKPDEPKPVNNINWLWFFWFKDEVFIDYII